jgi:FAD/FMN-containing dehydrogenase
VDQASGEKLITELRRVVGDNHVLSESELRARYERDWTGRFVGQCQAVVRPANTDEVAQVVSILNNLGVAAVAQGGNTGLVGGGVPRGGEVVVTLERLTEIASLDKRSRQVTVGAGATLQSLQSHLQGSGLAFGVDHGARSAATIGGMVATNAGGIHALRYGTMRFAVAGLEAVFSDGTVMSRMSGLVKDNAGYDLPQMIVGSEGTLALVTKARLRLVKDLPERATALFAVDDTQSAVELLMLLRDEVPSLEAAEVFYKDGLELVSSYLGMHKPFAGDHPAYVLVECAASYDPTEELAQAADGANTRDVAVAVDAVRRNELWSYRESHTEAINAQGIPHKLDVSVAVSAMPEFEAQVRELIAEAAPQALCILFGHLGDGNYHVNILGLEPDDETVDRRVCELVAYCEGSISAEHGIGIAKRDLLSLTRTEQEIEAMRKIKAALDPNNILNPGVIF